MATSTPSTDLPRTRPLTELPEEADPFSTERTVRAGDIDTGKRLRLDGIARCLQDICTDDNIETAAFRIDVGPTTGAPTRISDGLFEHMARYAHDTRLKWTAWLPVAPYRAVLEHLRPVTLMLRTTLQEDGLTVWFTVEDHTRAIAWIGRNPDALRWTP